jgi:chorismate mutase
MEAHLYFEKHTPLGLQKERPLIISGPCSAETEEQVIQTARALAALKRVHILRAGIWKPRTRPAHFEGIGAIGLKWLKAAREETGLLTAVEVANARHVQESLNGGVDVLWVGARTTANPFAVQEIADALKGVHIPVLVKNPVNPDIELWIGALERINKAGITRLGAIHRGFSSFERTRYRNNPTWELPIELKRRVPDLPVICDPSHICGSTELIAAVSQTAMDLDFDGLMIESHINPREAWSDAKQQLTPEEIGKLLNQLEFRKAVVDDVLTRNKLEEMRDRIDKMDEKLIALLADRMSIAEAIGQYKKDNNVAILQTRRWDEIVRTRVKSGTEKNLTKDFVLKLFEIIHQESIHHQSQIMHVDDGLGEPEVEAAGAKVVS